MFGSKPRLRRAGAPSAPSPAPDAPAAAPGAPVLQVDGLSFSYGAVPVLEGVSFSLGAGELAFLRGRNGSGKSTLLRCLAGLAVPAGGSIALDGAAFNASDRRMRRKVAFVPDDPVFYDDLTADEHLRLIRQANRIDARDDRAPALMGRLRLAEHGDRLPATFSRGMRMKLALVMALSARPRLLLLDEPFGPLDPEAADVAAGLVREALEDGAAVVLSLHQAACSLSPDVVLEFGAAGFGERAC